MNSDQIHKMRDEWLEQIKTACASGDVDKALAGFKSEPVLKITMLGEIAYQLAKLNEHFEKVDESCFGGPHAKKEKG